MINSHLTIISLFLVFLFLCIILHILYKDKTKTSQENFENEQNTNLSITSNRIKYLEYGMINFIAQDRHIDKIMNGDTGNNGSPYVFIYPNNIDIMCNATNLTNDIICQEINVMKSFERDTLPIYRNEMKANVISGSSQIGSNNNIMRIFDSEYKLKNRSILLNVQKVEPFVNKKSNHKYWYAVTVLGNVKSLILTRPFFITINEFGLYKIIYDSVIDVNSESNMFVSYSSFNKTNTFYIEKVIDDKAFPSTSNEIRDNVVNGQIQQKLTKDTPFTIYYAVFNRTLPFKTFDINSFVIHLDKVRLEKNKIIPSLVNFDFNSGNNLVSSDKINSMQLTKDKNNGYRYYITLNHNSATIKVELPENFEPAKYSTYDILIIYSYDVLTIVCLAKDSANEYCFVERRADKNYNLILETTKSNIDLQFTSFKDNYLEITSNPYLPLVANKYGYSLM